MGNETDKKLGIRRISTSKRGRGDHALVMEVGGVRVQLDHNEVEGLATGRIKASLEQVCKDERADTLIFVHRNRDGTLAIATGEEPDIWPEDEEKLV